MVKRVAALVFLAAFSAIVGSLLLSTDRVSAFDFRAFYCAGMAVREHADPYHTYPLGDCERSLSDRSFRLYRTDTTVPAPLPPYDLGGFALLSSLRFAVAKCVWGAMLALAITGSCLGLAVLLRAPTALAASAVAAPLAAPSLALGQLLPVYFAALVATMVLMQRRKFVLAGVAACATLVEPHLGVPICLALLIWVRQSRVAISVCIALLALLSLSSGGFQENIEYLTGVLPLHALSEVTADGQLSLTAILHGAGASDAVATTMGSVSYFLITIVAVAVAKCAATRYKTPAIVIALPAAAAIFGGAYVHPTDMIAAVPLGLLLSASPYGTSKLATYAIAVLIAPWWAAWQYSAAMLPWLAIGSAAAGYVSWHRTKATAIAAALAVLLFSLTTALSLAYARSSADFIRSPHVVHANIDPEYPEASWARAVEQRFSTNAPATWGLRIPTWLCLALLIGAAIIPPTRKSAQVPILQNG